MIAAVVLIGAIVHERSLYLAIRRHASIDEARPADAIVVFGAAQYNGRPSPVFKARLDYAFELEERNLVPTIITTGGSGGDRRFTEGAVGRDYLEQRGVSREKLIAETSSETTWESVQAVARLLRERHGTSCVAVSDGFHLYRIKLMFHAMDITAFTSPDPASPIEADPLDRELHSLREMVVVTLWQVGIRR
jgi:uncharacterized SAM-binding protein YcdF (DUF218 family)